MTCRTRPSPFWRIVLTLPVFLLAVLLACGCGESDEKKAQQYPGEYTRIMNAFEKRVAKDDARLGELVGQNDISGLIKLNNSRSRHVESVLGELLGLCPPSEMRRLHSLTLYYLVSITDQVDAQNTYYEALLTGKPVEDLKTIAESYAARTQGVGTELAVEVQKRGIKLESMSEKVRTEEQTVPEQTAPSGEGEKE